MAIVEFDLHVDDMGHPAPRHLRHIVFIPNTAADSNALGDPSHVHGLFVSGKVQASLPRSVHFTCWHSTNSFFAPWPFCSNSKNHEGKNAARELAQGHCGAHRG